MTLTKAQAAVLAEHLEAENGHQLGPTLDTLTTNCVFEDMTLGRRFDGHAGASAYYQEWWQGFPDLTVEPVRRHITNTGVVAEVVFRGTHQGTFRDLAPTGRRLVLPILILVEFEGSLMSGERFYYDALTIRKQLGAAT